MHDRWLQSLVSRGLDNREILELLLQDYEKLHSGGQTTYFPPEIIRDQLALVRQGIDRRGKVRLSPDVAELARRRERNPLVAMLPEISRRLFVGTGSDRTLALIDTDGFVLDGVGSDCALRLVRSIGLRAGINWADSEPATNAVRLAVRLLRSVFLFGHLHLRLDQSAVACAVSPVFDGNGDLAGFLDLVCPAEAANVDMPRLVNEVARSLTPHVDRERRKRLDLLRREAAGYELSRYPGCLLVIDWEGWVATARRWDVGPRVRVPEGGFLLGRNELDDLGPVVLEPLWGGWLVRRPAPDETALPVRVTLDLSRPGRSRDRAGWIEVSGRRVSWRHALTLKQSEILLLVSARDGLTPAELARELYAVPPASSTVRSAWLRVREDLRSVLVNEPYRFDEKVHVSVVLPSDKADLLPASTAPGIDRLRR